MRTPRELVREPMADCALFDCECKLKGSTAACQLLMIASFVANALCACLREGVDNGWPRPVVVAAVCPASDQKKEVIASCECMCALHCVLVSKCTSQERDSCIEMKSRR